MYIWRLCVCADTWVLLTVGVLKPLNNASWVCVGFRTAAFSSTSAGLPVRSWVLSFLKNTSLFFRLLILLLPIWFNPSSKWPKLIILLNSLSHPYRSPSLAHSLSPNCIWADFLLCLMLAHDWTCVNRKQLRRCACSPFSCQFLRKLEHVVTPRWNEHSTPIMWLEVSMFTSSGGFKWTRAFEQKHWSGFFFPAKLQNDFHAGPFKLDPGSFRLLLLFYFGYLKIHVCLYIHAV